MKYLIIATVNLIVLTALMVIWTDALETTCNRLVRWLAFVEILSFTVLSVLGMRLLVFVFRKKHLHRRTVKLQLAILLTCTISAYLYVDYTRKCIDHAIVNHAFRQNLVRKITPYHTNGTIAENLNITEYRMLAAMNHFPELPDYATHISYSYQYDGFLPDYALSISYDVPLEMDVEGRHVERGEFTPSQTVEINPTKKRGIYHEDQR